MRSKTFQSPPKKKPPSRHPSTSMVPGDLPTTKKVRFEESGPPRPIPATPAAPIEESGQPSSLADFGRTELPATYLNHAQPTPDLIPSSPPPQTKLQPPPRRNPSRIVTKKPPSRHPSTSMVPGDLPATKKVHFKKSGPPHPIPATPAAPMEESGQPSSLADSGRTELPATYLNHAQPTPDLIPSPPPPETELQPPLQRNPSRIATKKPLIQPQSHPAAGTNKRKVVDGVSITKSYGKQPRIAIPSQGKKKVKPCRATVVGERKIRHTRYVDSKVLQTLGMTEDFHWLCNKLGMSSFINQAWPTYTELTTSFLSTFECEIVNGHNCHEGKITFSIFGQPFTLTLDRFAAIYGLPSTGPCRHLLEFQDQRFWSSLSTGIPYNSHTSRSNSIIHPCLRYFMRVLANTIFAKGDMKMVPRKDELFVLWSAYNNRSACIATYLARQFQRVKNSNSPNIDIGGLITPIAHHFGISTDNLTVAPGPTTIDLDACQAMHIIDSTPHGYGVKYDDQHIFPLPYHNSYSIQDPAHFKTPLQYLATVPSSDDHLAEPATSAAAAPNHTEVTQHYETIEAPILGPTGPSMPTSTQESIHAPDLASHPIIQQLVNSQAAMQTDLHEQKQIVLEMKNMLSAFIHRPFDPPAY